MPGDSYADGWREGWKAIKGGAAAPPGIVQYGQTGGRTAFQEGVRRAVLKALESQGKLKED